MKHILPSLRILAFMTLLTGVAYPLSVTFIGQLLFPEQARGSFAKQGDREAGSFLVAQNFEASKFFWSRPSAPGYNPLPSGGSNLGPINADLKRIVTERRSKLMAAHPGAGEPPQDLLFASGSGLDPDITPEAALYQSERIAKARGWDVARVHSLIDRYIRGRQFGLLGEPRVNVLALNLALEESEANKESP